MTATHPAQLGDWIGHHGGVLGDTPEGALPLRFAELAAEVAAIETDAAVLPLEPTGVILLRGPDAEVFLNGLTTNDQKALKVGGMQPNLLCANKGKIKYEVLAIRSKPEEFLLLTRPDQLEAVAGHLNLYHIREELQLGQVGLVRIDLLGPRVEAVLGAHGISPADPAGRFAEAPLVTVPAPLGELPRIVALLPGNAAPALLDALVSGEPAARPVGWEAWEEVRIRAGLPRFGADYDADFLPAEAALYSHLNFNKGCYVGQEIHARMHHRGHPNRKLMAVSLPADGDPPEAGAPLYHEGDTVGRLTSVARLPREGRLAGIALVRYALARERTPVALAPEGAAEVSLTPLLTDLGRR